MNLKHESAYGKDVLRNYVNIPRRLGELGNQFDVLRKFSRLIMVISVEQQV